MDSVAQPVSQGIHQAPSIGHVTTGGRYAAQPSRGRPDAAELYGKQLLARVTVELG